MVDNLTVVVPFWNGHATINALLASIPSDVPVIVVDDVSDVPYKLHKPYSNVAVKRLDKKGYFSGAVNAGIEACKTDVLVLNQDATLTGRAWLDLLVEKRKTFATIGEGVFGHPAWPKGYIQGTFMFFRRDAIAAVGLLNQADYPLWGTTCEWQLRACRKGYKALPLQSIPGFVHARARTQRFGEAITNAIKLEPSKKDWFIRTPPAISVVIPCFNYGRYLEDAVNSLIGGNTSMGVMEPQTFGAFEIIIVDDKSTDESAVVAKALADPWKGIRFVQREKNGGTPAANNSGIKVAFGRYITILSADDMMKSDRLEMLYRTAEATPHSVIYDDLMCFAEGKEIEKLKMMEYDFDKLLDKNLMHAGIFFPRKAWQVVGGYPEDMLYGREDWCFNVGLGVAGYCGVHIAKARYLYRREKQNWSVRNQGPKWRALFRQQLESIYADIYKGARPDMCCGNNKKNAIVLGVTKISEPKKPAVAGGNGMVLLQYLGGNWGSQSFYGPVTGSQYVVSKGDPIVPVDPRDVESSGRNKVGLIDQTVGGKPAFRRYAGGVRAQVAAPKPAPSGSVRTQTPVVAAKVAKPAAVATPVAVPVAPKVDINTVLSNNVTTIRTMDFSGLTQEQIYELINAEMAGKNRKYVLTKLGTYLA